jgi:molecular chaperone HtpG
LILENCKELLPVWLRFIKWVVETNDIQLNISREMLQQNTILSKIQTWLTSKIISTLKNLMTKKTDEYDMFLNNYSWYLKEWIHFDFNNKEKIAELIKYESLLKWENITLDEYIDNWNKEQKEIYFITGKNKAEILSSPYLEEFKNKNIDVLLMFDPIDEWVIQDLPEFKWKQLKNITDQDINLWEESNEKNKENKESKEKDHKDLLEFFKKTIWEDKIESVNLSYRLWDNIWALASKQWWVSPQMEKMMKAMWQVIPPQKRILEINSENKLIKNILKEYKKSSKNEKLEDLILYIYEQSVIRQWWEIDDLKWFVNRMNKFAETYL